MGLEGIKLIACDLDGTLLHPGERELRSEAFELIDELHRRGIVFMPASGRQYASLRYLFAPVADELAYVCENGTLVMSEGRAVVKRSMERSLAMVIANTVVAYPHTDMTLSCEGHIYTMSGNDAFVDHLRYVVHCDVAVVDRPEDIDEDVIKIAFQTPEVDQPAALEYFERLFSDRVDVMTSGTEWTDFIGGKPSDENRIISLQIPDALLSALTLSTTNEDITLSPLAVTGSVILSSNGGTIIFEGLDVGTGLSLTVKNGNIAGTVAGSYEDFSIQWEGKKGDSNLPEHKDGGAKTLQVSSNNGDVEVEFVP